LVLSKVSIANPKVSFHVILLLSNAQNDLFTQPTLTFTLKLAKVTSLKPIILDRSIPNLQTTSLASWFTLQCKDRSLCINR